MFLWLRIYCFTKAKTSFKALCWSFNEGCAKAAITLSTDAVVHSTPSQWWCVQYLSDCVVSGLSLCFRSWALTRNDSYRSTYVCELLPGEVFDQAADQGAFPDLRGANNDNHNWRRFQGSPVYNRHVVFFGFYVLGPFWGTNKNKHQHSLKTWTWLILLCNAQHWPVEGFGHADRRLNCKCFGVAFAFILLCWAILFL